MKKYYLGLDIGTDSVGYAVTDEEYNILKFAGRPAWGATIFDPVSENAERRSFRSGRRRLDRRQQRVHFVQELFAKEIAKKDAGFFKRLEASALFREDAGERYSVFNDKDYTDLDYFREYPTIHHLIVDLMKSDEPHDVRLVYLACAWLVAHRGHFLSNIDKNKLSEIKDFNSVYSNFVKFFKDAALDEPWVCNDPDAFSKIIKEKMGVTAKYKKLVELIYGSTKPSKEATETFPYSHEHMLKLLAGGTCKLQDLFDNDEYADKGSVSLGMDDDKLGEIMSNIGDDYGLIEILRTIYDWSVLVDALGDASTISEAKVNVYEQHKKDLELLKYIIRTYKKDKYNEVFRTIGKDNYPAYVYHTDENKAELKKKNKEDFSKFVLAVVKDIKPDEKDKEAFNQMISRLEARDFMPKQKNTDNRVIPHQLYWYELKTLLDKAATYLPWLNDVDDSNLSVKEKIEKVFEFRIPYFVGPLNKNSGYSWLVRTNEKIYPWNFEKVVDLDASEQEFIKKLTNTCTYLPGEHVIPKDSLCYHKYMVLNEINNLKINGQKIDVELKQSIYKDLFMTRKKVTRKSLIDYLISNGKIGKDEESAVTGIDINVNSNLAPQLAFKRLMESGTLSESDVERIIERASYAEDKQRLLKYLNKEFAGLSEEDKKYIAGIKIKDFGRLSRKFLTEFEGVYKETGEVMTIMSALWNTNDNLMEILSDRYTFRENVESYCKEYYSEHSMSLSDRLDEMYISNSVKRPIYRTLDVVGDVVKAFGKPEKIFIEVTRSASDEMKGKRTKSRKQQILDLYAQCKDEDVKILQKQLEDMGEYADNKLQSDKLFLYYTQFGKCMYTGEAISLEKLASNELYNIDHIYPQAFVKDDSILNNKVLVLSSVNGKKEDVYPIAESIRNKMGSFWDYLKKVGCITPEKYKRLTRRTPFTNEEKMGFINRQLVETSQATKAIATILGEKYPDTSIVYSKAGLVSDFRHKYDLLKSRLFNDLHHAVDAYLNIVVGNVYDQKFSKRWFDVNSKYSVKTKTIFSHPVVVGGKTIWEGEASLAKVKSTAVKNNAHFTKYSFFKTGGLFDQMPVSAAEGLVPRKKDMPTEKYGGYNKSSVMFFIPVKYTCGKKTDIMIMSVELAHGKHFLEDEDFAKQYTIVRLRKILGKEATNISYPMGKRALKINTVLSCDGFRMCITASGGGGKCLSVQPIMQFSEDMYWQFYVKKLERLVDKTKLNSKYVFSEEYDYVNGMDNEKLYDIMCSKLSDSIYKLRPNNPYELFEKGRECFVKLTEIEQAKTLLNMLQVFGRMTGGCDLQSIGGAGKSASTVNFSSMISNWKKKYKTAYIVDISTTGFWEKKSINLIELL